MPPIPEVKTIEHMIFINTQKLLQKVHLDILTAKRLSKRVLAL